MFACCTPSAALYLLHLCLKENKNVNVGFGFFVSLFWCFLFIQ